MEYLANLTEEKREKFETLNALMISLLFYIILTE